MTACARACAAPAPASRPTGNRYEIDEIHIFRIRDGQVVEHWHEFDKMALMRQLKGEGA